MKKLQNNFTTPEQSKRLLELGVPEWTADLYFYEEGCVNNDDEPSGVIPYDEVYDDNSREAMFSSYVELPCWSVGRLIEIMKICNHPDDVDEVFCELAYSKKNLVELIVRLMEENKEITDFSKLEE
jgi:hypothetical protein